MKRLPRIGAVTFSAVTFVAIVLPTALGALQAPDAWPSRVLMTNDDGIDTPGIRALADALVVTTDVYVVAPAGNRSGSGSYVGSLSQGMNVTEVDWGDVRGAFAIDGYPADGVVWGLRSLLAENPPDLVISGINDGPNAGGAWIVSGTIGAARLAAFFGIPALAVSGYDPADEEGIRQVADWVSRFAKSSMVRGLEPGEYLLVNMPPVRIADVTGVVVAPLDFGFLGFGVEHDADSDTWRTRLAFDEMAPDGDWAALRRDQIVITPMRIGETQTLERFRDMLDAVPVGWGGAR